MFTRHSETRSIFVLRRVKGESEKYPEYIELKPKPPAMFDHLPLEDVISYFEKRIEEEEIRIRKERKKEKKSFRGSRPPFSLRQQEIGNLQDTNPITSIFTRPFTS